mgnify:CR=1 FL=1
MTMNNRRLEVGIADLKSRLSEHLRRVRAGRTLTVLDRDTPIARIVPWDAQAASGLSIRQSRAGAVPLGRMKFPPPLAIKSDVVKLLLIERQADR